ncbi:amino acid adenylation domain-containing protein [Phreatobacter aquaticus]|uniref:Amino acid adenylation domain-containing protein n=1 Tax=Phreatobacter aquaticus TaxID=2570229 RepID=A0A4D7QLD0_9HYPH|nr:amino acid adenylation domain-containing protein [Phreatobacter aquaticus]
MLQDLRAAGIRLFLDGQILRFEAPPGALTPDLRSRIALARPVLIEHLGSLAAAPAVSPRQSRLWFACRLAPEEAPYNVAAAFRLSGPLDIAALEAALGDVIAGHPALRTGFREQDGEPQAFLRPEAPFRLERIDAGHVEPGERDAFGRALAERLSREPIALDAPPLLRETLVRFAPDDHLLIHVIHHIVTDGWSHGLFCRDLSDAYRQRLSGKAWRNHARSTSPARTIGSQPSGGARAPVKPAPLPHDVAITGGRRYDGATLSMRLPPAIRDQVAAMARRERTSPAAVLLAVQLLFVARLAGTASPVVAVPAAAGRTSANADEIGYFVDTVTVPVDRVDSDTFQSFLARVHLTFTGTLDAASRGSSDEVGPAALQDPALQDPGLNDPALTSFAYQATPDAALDLDGVAATALGFERGTTRFDLELHVWPQSGHATSALLEPPPESEVPYPGAPDLATGPAAGFRLMLAYRRTSFEPATAARFLRQFSTLLSACLASPDVAVDDLALIPEAESADLARLLERPRPCPAGGRSVADLFEETARRFAGRPALETSDGSSLTYADLDRASAALAARLTGLGLRPGAIVGVLMERSEAAIIALLAVIRAGGAYLPLDPALPDERLALMIADAGVAHLVTTPALGHRIAAGPAVLLVDGLTGAPLGDGPSAPLPAPDTLGPDSPAYVNFTSGSTGRPKGILVPHGAIANLVLDTDYAALGPADRIAQAATLSFDAATFEIWGALLNGACLVPLARETLLDTAALTDALATRRISTMFLTTALFNQMAQAQPAGFSSLRLVLFGGEAVNPDRVRQVRAACPGLQLTHVYGPTETTTFATFHPVETVPEAAATVPIGRPLAGVICRILDVGLRPVPPGATGELYLGGRGLALGYLGQPEATAARFITRAGERLYRTGDLVRLGPGNAIEFVGRADNQVKIRGHRIEPEEIEIALAAHPAVTEAAVIVRGTDQDRRLHAFVAVGEAGAAADIAPWLRQRLPDYMVPARIEALPHLPMTSHGKVDRAALRALAEKAAPEPVVTEPAASDLERQVMAIWSDLLQTAVGPDSDFFDIGGHSLLATRVAARLLQATGLAVPLRLLFEQRTPRDLALALSALERPAADEAEPPLVVRAPGGPTALSFAQQRLWFLERLDPGTAGYNVPLAYELDGRIDMAALQKALDRLIERHDTLRSRIFDRDGQSWQEPLAPMACPLALVDLGHLPIGIGTERARDLIRAAALAPFDLARPPLIRAHLFRLSEDRSILLLVLHHIASDGWSLTVLARDLSLLVANRTAKPLPIRYADFALWQRDWFQGERAQQQLAAWTERLTDLPDLRLPTDRRRPQRQSYRGGTVPIAISGAETEALRALAAACNATPFMVLLAIFGATIGRAAAQMDFAIACPVANRHRPETEGLIGFFVNTLAMRLDRSGGPSLRQLIGRIRAVALDAFQNQDLPFEQVVETLHPDRDPARNPLVQVAFALQNATDERLDIPGIVTRLYAPDIRTTRFDLEMHLFERGTGIEGILVFATDLFEPATAERLAGQFSTLLSACLTSPDVAVDDLALIPEAESADLARLLERPRPCPAGGRSVADLFEETARRFADRPALEAADGSSLTYADLDRASAALTARLTGLGLRPGAIVGVLMERSEAAIIALLAVIRAGGAYLPLDPALPDERLALMIADAGVAHLVTTPALGHRIAAGPAVLLVDGLTGAPLGDGPAAPLPAPDTLGPDSPAYVNFTSGSTGRPKGILVPHGAIANLVLDTDYAALGPADRIAQAATLSFDAATFEIWGALLNGACLVPLARETLLDTAALTDALATRRISTMFLTTALFNQVAQAQPAGFAPLRLVLFGGEAVNPDRVRQVRAACPGLQLTHVYGPTETTTFATFHPVETVPEAAATVPIGRPLAGVICRILDVGLRPVPPGATGELYLGGRGLALGYLGQPEATAARFIARAGERLYRTGDLVRLGPGNAIEFVGRADNQVKIRGHRIEPEEIEIALAAHPAVTEAAVIVRGTDQDRRLHAFVAVGDSNAALSGRDSQAFVADWLELYEDTYKGDGAGTDADLAGWNDSYTGQPLPVAEMREWQEATVAALLAGKPRHVLEIGCGTGLLLKRLADAVESYRGTDFSPSAVARTGALARRAGWSHVSIEHRQGDDAEGLPRHAFDLIVLNSVIQYFPGEDYLRRVIRNAFDCLAPGGRLFIGDIRSLPLQRMFAASVEARRGTADRAVLERAVATRIRLDKELVLDPAFFLHVARDHAPDARVEIAMKRGWAINELTKYRYDVMIETGGGERPATRMIRLSDRPDERPTVEALVAMAHAGAEPLCIVGLPDARLARDLRILAELDAADGPAIVAPAPHPEEIASSLEAAGFCVSFAVPERPEEGRFDLLVHRRGSPRPASPLEASVLAATPARPLANNPLRAIAGRNLIPDIKAHLARHLPDYMVPSSISVLERLPMNRSGKIDRRALVPDNLAETVAPDTLPVGKAEAAVQQIWCDLLQVDMMGRTTNFFDAGGHSLLLVQLLHRINARFGCQLSLIDMFRATTIAAQAEMATARQAPPAAPDIADRADRARHALAGRRDARR